MSNDETHHVKRVVAEPLECGIGEAEDDRKNGSGEVSQEGSPDGGQSPVRTTADDGVEVVSKLVALSCC